MVSFITIPIIEASFSRYSGPAVIGMLFGNSLAFLGAIYLWQAYKAAIVMWLVGYTAAVIPILLLPSESAVAPDQPWIWFAVPVIACDVVIINCRKLKW
jgi:hypothetical protein